MEACSFLGEDVGGSAESLLELGGLGVEGGLRGGMRDVELPAGDGWDEELVFEEGGDEGLGALEGGVGGEEELVEVWGGDDAGWEWWDAGWAAAVAGAFGDDVSAEREGLWESLEDFLGVADAALMGVEEEEGAVPAVLFVWDEGDVGADVGLVGHAEGWRGSAEDVGESVESGTEPSAVVGVGHFEPGAGGSEGEAGGVVLEGVEGMGP